MSHCIARILDPLLRLLWPAPPARHRAVPSPAALPVRTSPPLPPRPTRAPEPYYTGEDSALVRPYLLAHEQRAEERRRRARRRTLWLAVHGIDLGPRVIHGIEITA
ncbi:hypothetical protein [Streptomyces thermolilacinus]|uniref:Uncharacterized protein n=1 Tax=Streptomyces thermolilacinus SPC6 TaxID=1306406 RepID=A0A1D3DV33_9ACTN|nr:hypothetical protein [Streptomyces thermolilacinus]OEJ96184.1 hypothetical protein J116_018635 [Streptomyces thermolilacinus SPC6]